MTMTRSAIKFSVSNMCMVRLKVLTILESGVYMHLFKEGHQIGITATV